MKSTITFEIYVVIVLFKRNTWSLGTCPAPSSFLKRQANTKKNLILDGPDWDEQ